MLESEMPRRHEERHITWTGSEYAGLHREYVRRATEGGKLLVCAEASAAALETQEPIEIRGRHRLSVVSARSDGRDGFNITVTPGGHEKFARNVFLSIEEMDRSAGLLSAHEYIGRTPEAIQASGVLPEEHNTQPVLNYFIKQLTPVLDEKFASLGIRDMSTTFSNVAGILYATYARTQDPAMARIRPASGSEIARC